jgi:uncharacterized membrane protein YfcA
VFDTSDPRLYLFAALAIVALLFLHQWVSTARASAGDGSGKGGTRGRPSLFELAVGFGTNFFDTLGIGSFAPTTSLFKLAKTVPDEEIPGTMMTGHTPPVIIQAFIFMAIIIVDPVTLFTLIAAAVLGAWLGAGVVARLPRHWIQIGMGIALLIAAGTFLRSIFGTDPVGGLATGVTGADLLIAAICLCVLGALMTIGIGMYAPTMIVVSMMGMTPAVAFPIMMGSAAFLMAVAGIRFARAGRYGLKAALGLAIGGIPAVLIAAFIVRSLPLDVMRWLVVVVVLYAAVAMLRSAAQELRQGS